MWHQEKFFTKELSFVKQNLGSHKFQYDSNVQTGVTWSLVTEDEDLMSKGNRKAGVQYDKWLSFGGGQYGNFVG